MSHLNVILYKEYILKKKRFHASGGIADGVLPLGYSQFLAMPGLYQRHNTNLVNEWNLYIHSMIFDHVKQSLLMEKRMKKSINNDRSIATFFYFSIEDKKQYPKCFMIYTYHCLTWVPCIWGASCIFMHQLDIRVDVFIDKF